MFYPGLGDTLNAVPGFHYYDTSSVSNLSIFLTIVDVLGCSDTWEGNVNQVLMNPLPQASKYDLCPGDSTTFFLNGGFSNVIWYLDSANTFSGNSFTHQFNSAGSYDISLMVENSLGCSDSLFLEDFIVVHPFPEVHIVSDPSEDVLCLPVQITFTDSSIVDAFASRDWNFFNSATVNPDPSVSWPYELPGNYQVSLTVTSAYGCVDSELRSFEVQGPLADFELTPSSICQGESINLQLIDTSNVLGWLWDFGDGISDSTFTSTVTHTYTPDYYPIGGQTFVSLVYWSENCEVTKSSNINFYPQVVADFVALPNDSVVCFGDALQLNEAISNGANWVWDMGDGISYSNGQQVVHNYATTGSFELNLFVSSANNCQDTISKEFIVTDINAEFIASTYLVCDSALVSFTNLSYADAGIANASFSLHDGTLVDSFITEYNFNTPPVGSFYELSYSINDSLGCADSYNMQIQFSDPNADFLVSSLQLCEDEVVTFEAYNLFDTYLWDLGDGTFSSDVSPAITYTQAGTYLVSLVGTNTLGCVDSAVSMMPIVIYDKPEVSFTFTPNLPGMCIPAEYSFVNTSTCMDQTNIIWTVLPDTYTSDVINLTWSDVGVYNVTLEVSSIYGCSDLLTQTFSAEGPTGTLTIVEEEICINTNAQLQLANSTDVVTWIWDFGDGVIDATGTTINPIHTYNSNIPPNGWLYVDLIISSTNCSDTLMDSIFVANPQAVIDPLDYLCINDNNTFNNLSTGSNAWTWSFGDGFTSNEFEPTHSYSAPGSVMLSLVVSFDPLQNCSDNVTTILEVLDPQLDFFFVDSICHGSVEPFNIVVNGDVYNWSVMFYDGASPVTGTGSSTGSYAYPESYSSILNDANITIEYSSINGLCPLTAQFNVPFYQVIADFIAIDNPDFIICKGASINLEVASQGADYNTWSFGDGTNGVNGDNVVHSYDVSGSYDITLIAINAYNSCLDTKTKTLTVRDDQYVLIPEEILCEGDSIMLSVDAEGGISSYHWQPEEFMDDPYSSNPFLFISTTQTIFVDIVDGFGCPGKGEQTLLVVNQPPVIDWDTTIIVGESVHLDAWFADNFSYNWNEDETLDVYDVADPWAFTLEDNTYTVTLHDSETECFNIENTYKIIVRPETTLEFPTVFTPNSDGVNDYFVVHGWGIKELIEFRVYNRWGELVFEGINLEDGWDGTYQGEAQPNDTYIYVTSVRTWLGETLEKKGYINLVR